MVPTPTVVLPILTVGVAPYPTPPSDIVKEEIVPATEAYITAKDIESSGSEADWIAKTNPLFLPEPRTYNLD